MFFLGVLGLAFTALLVATMDDAPNGLKEGTCLVLGAVLLAIAWVGGIFFLGGRGILW